MDKKPFIVYIDDEIENLRSFRLNFIDFFNIEIFDDPLEFLNFLKNNTNLQISIIIADYRMPKMDGITLLTEVKKFLPSTRRIIISAYDDSKILLDAINRAQIHKYILKPWDKTTLLSVLEEQIELYELTNELNKKYEEIKQKNIELMEIKKKLEEENRILKSSTKLGVNLKPKILEVNEQIKILILNPIMHQIYRKIEKLKDNLEILFITGEKGVGKKLLVKYILNNSRLIDNKDNLVVLDAFILKGKIIDELRHTIQNKLANSGIIYITNIEELENKEQKELLSIMEEKTISFNQESKKLDKYIFILSSTKQIDTNMTNNICEELLYFLLPFHFHIPALRYRKDEIPALINYYISIYCKLYNKKDLLLNNTTLQYLLRYKWPGNIDELKKNIRSAVLLADEEINQEHFSLLPNFFEEQFEPENILNIDKDFNETYDELEFMIKINDFKNGKLQELNYDQILDEFEKFVFRIALEKTDGNKARAASLLNLKPGKFLYKTKYLGL